ncbi:site-specific integrase [Subtercola frigoramans]|uniref:Integrase n=1 Tax=Subtercola frigoramans TaxID=120298 RepID=A0ABS2L0F2_9MICO|nr:site-specific integrase [Subtercola frigoramans]MBM7470524.1 integrase [Subtercola frigoramans]
MGSISSYQTAEGRRYRVRYRRPDKSQTDKRGFKTKREAELFAASVEMSMARGEYIEASASRVTVNELGIGWLATQTHLKPSSLRPAEIAWRVHVNPVWGTVSVGDVRHTDVQNWVSELSKKRGATTVIRAYGVLAAILDSAVRDRRLPSNPARGVNLPRKVAKEHQYLTHQQVHDLAAKSGDYETLIFVLAYTGLRWGEAIGMRASDVDFDRRRIRVSVNAVEVGTEIFVGTPKSHKRRIVAFPEFLEPALREQLRGKTQDDLVFPGEQGGHLRRATRGTRTWFKSALKAAELQPMTLHDLRHTAASLAVSSGGNVKAVQRMLGHASAAMTLDVYADLFDADLDTLAEGLNEAARKSVVGKMWARDESQGRPTP